MRGFGRIARAGQEPRSLIGSRGSAPRGLLRMAPALAVAILVLALFPASAMADGSATQFLVAGLPEVTAGDTNPFTVTAADSGGVTDTSYTGTVAITCSDLGVGVSCPTPLVPADFTLGVATVNVKFVTAGPQTISADDGSISGTSDPITVDPAGIHDFAVGAVGSQTAGVAFSVTATAEDQYGNTVTSYTGTPTLSNNFGSTGGAPVAGTFTAFVAGVGTSSGTKDLTAETGRTVTVTDSTTTGTSNTFTVGPNVLDHFGINAIGSQSAGTPFAVTAKAEDLYNNTVTSYAGTPVLTNNFSSTGGSPVAGTFTPFVLGVGTSSGTTDFTAETLRTVTVTGGGKAGTSNTFTVGSAAVDHFVVSAVGGQTAGTAFAVTATAKDLYGNTVTGYVGTPTLTNTFSSTGGAPVAGAFTPFVAGVGTSSGTTDFTAENGVTVTVTGGGKSGTSNAFNVGPNVINHFVVSAIGGQTAGTPFAVTATAKDLYGNTVTSYTGTPTLTNNFSSTGGAPAAGAFTPFVAGVGTSSGTTDFTAETLRTVTVTDSGKTGTSGTFTVGPNVLDHFVITAIGTQTAGSAFPVTATAKDLYGNTVTGYVGTPTLTNTFSSTGGVPVAGTFTPFVLGVGTSSGTTDFTAENGVTVTVTGGGKAGTSNAFNVGTAVVDHFVVSAVGTQTAGTPFAVTATAKDQYGNTVTTYTGTPTLTNTFSSTGGAPVVGTFTPFVLGVGTSSGTTDFTAETGVTVTVNGSGKTGTSAAFNVNPNALDHFVLNAIGGQTAGTAFAVTATAKDLYGNTVTSYLGTPTLTNTFSATGGAPAAGAFTPFVLGVGTSSGTTDFTAETGVTVTVTGGGKSGTSNAFNVGPSLLDHFAVTAVPTQTAGTAFAVTATAKDVYGNTVTTYLGIPVLTNTFGSTGGAPVAGTFTAFVAGVGTSSGTTDFTAETGVTVTVTGGGKAGTSNAFNVNPNALDHFAIATVAGQVAGAPFDITATAEDVYGNTVTGYVGTPTLTNTFGSTGGAPVAGTFTAFVAGVGTSSGTTDFTAETGVTVTVTGGGKAGTSNAFAVAPAALDHFAVGTVVGQVAGTAFAVTATAKDLYGNTVTSYVGIPVLTNNFTGTGLNTPVAGTFTAFVAGVGTSSGTTDFTAETLRTVTVTDTTITGTSNTFTVAPGALAKFVLTPSASPYNVGAPFSVTVAATDAHGNVVPGYVGKVHFVMTGSGSTVPVDYQFLAADHGQAIKTPFTPGVTGLLTVTANDTVLTGITGTVNVNVVGFGTTTVGVALTTGNTPANFGTSLTFTATVAGGGATPTGTVAFYDGDPATTGIQIGTAATLVSGNPGNASGSVTIATLYGGSHNIYAVYSGDANYNTSTSTSPRPQVITPILPGAPITVTGVGLDSAAQISWLAPLGPVGDGGAPITAYTVTSTPGSKHCSPVWVFGNSLTCKVTGLANFTPYTFTVTATTSAGTGPLSIKSGNVVPRTGSTYVALTPSRILDTAAHLQLTSPVAANVGIGFQVTHQFPSDNTKNVPDNASAVTGVLSVSNATAVGFLALTPTVVNTSTTSTLNFPAGDAIASGVTVPLGAGGTLGVLYGAAAGSTADVAFDVTGYFETGTGGATYFAVTPNRLLDSRPSGGGHTNTGLTGVFNAGANRTFQVTNRVPSDSTKNVPVQAVAVTGTLTVTGQTKPGFITLEPDANDAPTTASLYFPIGDNRATGLTVKLGTSGTLSLTYTAAAGATTNIIFDVTGFFLPGTAGAMYVPVTPNRILDTRKSAKIGLPGSLIAAHGVTFHVTGRVPSDPTKNVPSTAVAVTGTLTVTNQKALGFLALTKTAVNAPTTSTLNFPLGVNRATGVTVPLGSGGTLGITYGAAAGKTCDAIFDVTGYFVL